MERRKSFLDIAALWFFSTRIRKVLTNGQLCCRVGSKNPIISGSVRIAAKTKKLFRTKNHL
ncbi:MAG: hypothetical protein DWQ58_09675 [Microcystis aeruginosa TA09]|nr:MAG: hypothetical protein DWQ58_09675 [Microcystis aeruginosa TA09]